MKQITRFFTAMTAAALLFISCQNPGNTPDKGKDIPDNKDDGKKTEYTVSFDANVPDRDGSVWYYCSDSAPEDVKIEKGKTVTLPSFAGELCRIIGSDEEGVYPFVKWNTEKDGSGTDCMAGETYTVTEDVTLYAVWSTSKKASDTQDAPDGDYLDLSKTSSYEMKIGDRIQLWTEGEDFYEITTGNDVVSIDSNNVIEAIGGGTATVQVFIQNSVQTYSVVITVTADSSDAGRDSALVGRWYDGDSYFEFYSDGTGYLYFKSGSNVFLNTACSWNTSIGGGKNWINISGCNPGSSNGSYEYSVSGNQLSIHGRIAFGMAMDTVWYK